MEEFVKSKVGRPRKYNWEKLEEEGKFKYKVLKSENYRSIASAIRTYADRNLPFKVKIETLKGGNDDVVLVVQKAI